tara:strand:- start:646 stop:777 length:132 start_codon:yes stop_codon:yes gene_type:complete
MERTKKKKLKGWLRSPEIMKLHKETMKLQSDKLIKLIKKQGEA